MLKPHNLLAKDFGRNRTTYIGADRCSAMDTEVSAPGLNADMPGSHCAVPVQFPSTLSGFPCKTRTRQGPSQQKQKKWSLSHSARNKGSISCKSERGGKTFLALGRRREERRSLLPTLSYLHL